MKFSKGVWRGLVFLILITVVCGGLAVPVNSLSVRAAPQRQVATSIVISEFRTRGTTATDEFVELYNPTGNPIDISGWTIKKSSGCGATIATLETIPVGTSLSSGQYYLASGLSYAGTITPDYRHTTDWSISDTGGVAVLDSGGVIIDQAGMCATTLYREGTFLTPLTGNSDQSYERKLGGTSDSCQDTTNNSADFQLITPSSPHNSSSSASLCGAPPPTLTPTSTPSDTPTSTHTSSPTTTGTPTRTPTITRTNTPVGLSSVIINEVAWAGTVASSNDEWIELRNTTNRRINLSGWVLRSTTSLLSIPLSGFISSKNSPKQGFFVLAHSANIFQGITPDLVYSGRLGNNGEILYLIAPSGVPVDTANKDGGPWPAGLASPTYASMERRTLNDTAISWYTFAGTPIVKDKGGNWVKGTPGKPNWAISVTATPSSTPTITRTPTPKKTPTRTLPPPPPPPLLAINEFVPRPGHDWNNDGVVNVGDEYIEILNHGTIPANLNGYSLDDEVNVGSTPFRLPGVTLQPGQRMVFYGSQTHLLLSDGGDGVRLLKPNGQLMDAYNYVVVRFPDQSFCRLPDDGGADDWNTNCYPTPGLRNALSGSFVSPPQISSQDLLCPIADTLPLDFILAECPPFGNGIFRPSYWDNPGWYNEKNLPQIPGKWPVFVD